MLYTPPGSNSPDADEALYQSLEPVIKGMGMSLLELSVYRGKARGGNDPSVQVKLVVYSNGVTGIDDCSRVHRGILPRLDLAFPQRDVYVEVSSPGIDRLIKDGSEFAHYIGKGVRCYCTDTSDWTEGVVRAADEKGITLEVGAEEVALPFEIIAKAKLSGGMEKIK